MKFLVTDIVWDREVDGVISKAYLPPSVEVEAEDVDSAVDVASDMTGYCIISASVEEV